MTSNEPNTGRVGYSDPHCTFTIELTLLTVVPFAGRADLSAVEGLETSQR